MKLKNTIIVLLYIALMALMVSWQDHQNTPNTMYRLVFLGVSILPAFIYKKYNYVPIIIALFFTVNYFGTALSYYPTYTYYYTGLVFIAYLFAAKKRSFSQKNVSVPWPIMVIVPLVLIVDFVTRQEMRDTLFSFLFLLFCCSLFSYDLDEKSLLFLKLAFIISTVVLCTEYYTVGKDFVRDYSGGMERESWTDPNYFGCVVGMGTILAAIELLSRRNNKTILKLFYIATILLSVPVLILNASRGALLATTVGIVYYIIVSKSRFWVKIVTVIIGVLFLSYLYNNNYFDLLEVRIEGDAGTGSGRTNIWERKMDLFWSESQPLQLLFGYGGDGGLRLGFNYVRGFHNEFLAMLVEYGVVGFFCFVSLVFYPVIKSRYNRDVVAVVLYFILVCLTLEPITSGYITYFCFVLLIIRMSSYAQKSNYLIAGK